MRSPRSLAILALAFALVSTATAQTSEGCCGSTTYPEAGMVFNNIDTVVASWTSDYPLANLTLYCTPTPGSSTYSWRTWANVGATGVFNFAYFTSDVTIDEYPSSCNIEIQNTEDTYNWILGPAFTLTNIAGVSVSTYSLSTSTAAATTAFITTTAPGTTETIIASASATSNPSAAATSVTSATAAASTPNDKATAGASGTAAGTAVGASTVSTGTISGANSTTSPTSLPSPGLRTGAKTGIAIGVIAVVAALIAGLLYLMRTRRKLRVAEKRATMYQADAAGGVDGIVDGTRKEWSLVPQFDSQDIFSDKQTMTSGPTYNSNQRLSGQPMGYDRQETKHAAVTATEMPYTPHMPEAPNDVGMQQTKATGYTYSNEGSSVHSGIPYDGHGAFFSGPAELSVDQMNHGLRHHELE